jgi:peptidoglycan/xylan/chitin deacetylase (PgdA/CDA1 family)
VEVKQARCHPHKPRHASLTVAGVSTMQKSATTQHTVQSSMPKVPSATLQRACACSKHTTNASGECEECKKKREAAQLQRSAIAPAPDFAPPIVYDVLRSAGQPLDAQTRAFMEPHFGHDFSQVRVHTDPQAAQSAQAVNALAYTVGDHVAFGAGEFQPSTNAGRELLAHELTHVVQQDASSSASDQPIRVGPVADRYEQQAHELANASPWGHLQARYNSITGSETPIAAQPEVASYDAPLGLQRVELTYDDGPDEAGNTQRILNELKRTGARATFYVVGRRVVEKDNWRVVFDIAASGSWLGNHAFDWNMERDNHIFLNGSSQERARKILMTEWAIRDALIKGKAEAQSNKTWETIPQANRNYIDDLIAHGTGRFRTPGFKSKWWREDERKTIGAIADVNEILAASGMRIFAVSDEVDVDPKDYQAGKTASDIQKSVESDLDENSDSILLHSRISASAQATPAIISTIQKHKWSFDAPSQGGLSKLMPQNGFAGLSTISDPPTHAEIMQARKFLFDNVSLGPILMGYVAIGIFKMAQAAGEAEVRDFMKELETRIIKTTNCNYYAATCLAENNNFALLMRFMKVWLDKQAFPRDPSQY